MAASPRPDGSSELEPARLQEQARVPAQHRDWNGVAVALKRAEGIAASNPWVAATLGELRSLAARKHEVMFAKEASFSARRMNTRLATRNELGAVHDSAPAASYLRRKTNQGKADKQPPQ